ncbi:MAG: cation transporter [Dehalococcoidia bacterium]
MEKIELEVRGMTCDHCVTSIRNAVQELPGVESAQVDLEGGSAEVEGQNLDRAAIIAAIEEEGYEASVRS